MVRGFRLSLIVYKVLGTVNENVGTGRPDGTVLLLLIMKGASPLALLGANIWRKNGRGLSDLLQHAVMVPIGVKHDTWRALTSLAGIGYFRDWRVSRRLGLLGTSQRE